ncbi:MAG: ABC transporter C-terminal domain-containing protein [Aquabacterium sp.]|uniref:ABC transporter C-terminal domain-containing protein n=1 Tax=Aquabacterium sp. TaxID=1872578 RepID=UPI002720B744|nr:ABC transporter C-terminal domain-containing protein [Aquabacterium sp.]MDO9006329.1 ABC transporter C-terminal domain-containing protein [Aquabacterium sp.]
MISVSDIIKLLDQLPIWKTIKALPPRIEALENRIAALEGKAAMPAPAKFTPGEPCPACGAHALRRTSAVKSKGPFGVLGRKDKIWTCGACKAEDHREGI